MVVVKSCYTVTPAEATFDGPIPLSDCDQYKIWSLTPTIYVYPPNNSFSFSQVVETLKVSLSRALVPFYPLAGHVRWIGGGRLEMVCDAKGAEFVVAESESTLEEFGDLSPSGKIKPLLPLIDYALPIEELPTLSVRVTRFPCGGFTIGLAVSHTVVDGQGAMHFIRSWTKLARGEALHESDAPFHDRSVLSSPRQHLEMEIPEEWRPLPLLLGHADANEEREKETTFAMLKLTRDQIQGIKKRASYQVCSELPFTRFESISAHLWKCACKARGHDHEQPTVFQMAGDIRRRVNPPLPNGYIGNANVRVITDPKCVSGELASRPLSYAAGKIREAVRKLTDEYIKSTLGFIGSQEDVSWMRSSFHMGGGKKGPFLGNPNMFMTSWMGLPMRDADFGWGKPSYVGPGVLTSDGKCFILPSCDEDESLVVALRLQNAHMPSFQRFFYEDI